uniref:F-box domain-containing protein n=1 Tax=Panagrellus redivivus TaxID=6233 RepID=A0A7E4VPR0_PANRE
MDAAPSTISLQRLPPEVLYQIFSHVPARQVTQNLRKINRRFHNVAHSSDFWVNKLEAYDGIRLFPRMRRARDLSSLVRVATELEDNFERFDENDCLTDYLSSTQHIATPDVFHMRMIQNRRILFSGARDHKVVIWDLDAAVEARNLTLGHRADINGAHTSWIWGITTLDDHSLFTSGWDGLIKSWTYGGSVVMRDSYNANIGVVSLDSVDETVIGGTFNGRVLFCDFRTPEKLTETLTLHMSAVLAVKPDPSNYSLTVGSANGKIQIYDRRKLTEPLIARRTNSPKRIAFGPNTISITSEKHVLMLDSKTLKCDLNFSSATDYTPFFCIPTDGGYYCADDFDIKVYSAGTRPKMIAQSTFSSRINNIAYWNGDIIAGLGEGSIQFWPREQIEQGRLNPGMEDNVSTTSST